jgi:hypothetical protein
MAEEKALKIFKHKAEKKIKEIDDRIKKEPKFQRTELAKTGPTSSEFNDVVDKVLNFAKPMHNFFPTIVRIEKVTNFALEQKFEEAKLEAFGTHVSQKFHGTGSEGVKKIPKEGFKLPGPPKSGQKPGEKFINLKSHSFWPL